MGLAPPLLSSMHFFTWLVLAAPASFFSAADLSQAAVGSFSPKHYIM